MCATWWPVWNLGGGLSVVPFSNALVYCLGSNPRTWTLIKEPGGYRTPPWMAFLSSSPSVSSQLLSSPLKILLYSSWTAFPAGENPPTHKHVRCFVPVGSLLHHLSLQRMPLLFISLDLGDFWSSLCANLTFKLFSPDWEKNRKFTTAHIVLKILFLLFSIKSLNWRALFIYSSSTVFILFYVEVSYKFVKFVTKTSCFWCTWYFRIHFLIIHWKQAKRTRNTIDIYVLLLYLVSRLSSLLNESRLCRFF